MTRCFLKAFSNGLAFESQNTQEETGKLLPKNSKDYIVYIRDDNPDIKNINRELILTRQALKEFEKRLPFGFIVIEDLSYYNKVDVDIFLDFSSNDAYLTDGILAWGGYPNGVFRGKMKFNNKYIWLDGYPLDCDKAKKMGLVENCVSGSKLATFNYKQTFKHELGHVLGLQHVDDEKDVMFWLYGKHRVMLGKVSLAVLEVKYGLKNISSRWLNWIKRVIFRREF